MKTVATAGHVDHGKSSLVLALTGTDPDRFPEEKTRGLTIDLGFAFCTLASGTEIGFVDVPGHVRFIKNMLAGVGALDTVLFVVAATEGWMPQSEEHLRILEVLGVTRGMVAITKADLVDDETVALARLEIEERLSESPLAGIPIVACDSVSGRGLDEVRRTLDAVLDDSPGAPDLGRPRLWVDRVFAAKGAGTVVTGTLTRGRLAVDDQVETGDPPRVARVRAIETAGRQVDVAMPGSRVALNLVGIERADLARGHAVVTADHWLRPRVADVAVEALPGAPVKSRGRLQAYVGSGEHRVWFRSLDDPGRFARLRFDDPITLALGDRIVLRDPGTNTTVAGAEVLDLDPSSRAKDAAATLVLPFAERILVQRPWLGSADLARLLACSEPDADATLQSIVHEGSGVAVGSWIVASAVLESFRVGASDRVLDHHRRHPHEAGIEISTLAIALRLRPEQLRAALADAPELDVSRGIVRHASHVPAAESEDARALVAALEAAPFAPPAPKDLGVAPSLVRSLVREGLLVDLDGVVFSAGALDLARGRVVGALREHGSVTVADVRDLLGSTRKYVMPIVGWLDRTGVTRRLDDDRVPGPTSGIEVLDPP
ncbi:MAG: selenocysteine-specific translation elongation factor [Acidimicrobiia bacterium]|nr:selenocysteine-specific translation elongation factor [Acidimicrobiia bacterium]